MLIFVQMLVAAYPQQPWETVFSEERAQGCGRSVHVQV